MDTRLTFPPALVAAIANAVADELEARGALATRPASPWLTVDYMRCARQRVYDLVSADDLEPARDGRRLLFRRDQLDDYLANGES